MAKVPNAGAPRKDSLDYFRMPTNFFETDQVLACKYEFGPLGPIIILAVQCIVYANGSFARMNRTQLNLAVKAKIGHNYLAKFEGKNRKKDVVDQVIDYLAQEGVLDSASLSDGIVTSAEIQASHRDMSRAAKRRLKEENYWLLQDSEDTAKKESAEALVSEPEKGISSEEIGISSEENGISSGNNPTKESKEKKNIKPYTYPRLRAHGPFFDNFILNTAFCEFIKAREERYGPVDMETVELLASQLEMISDNDNDRILTCRTATASRWKNFYLRKSGSGQQGKTEGKQNGNRARGKPGSFLDYEQRGTDYSLAEKQIRGYGGQKTG